MATVSLYTTDNCSHCLIAKEVLERNGIEYEAVNLTRNPEDRHRLVELTGNYSFPQIVANGVAIGGLSDLLKLEQSDGLEELIAN